MRLRCPRSQTGAAPEAFELAQFAVDGKTRPIRRSSSRTSQVYSVSLEAEARAKQDVTISYTYRVLVQRNGHLLHLDFSRPANGLKVKFLYGDCGIRHVNVLDYIASTKQARVSVSPDSVPTPSIDVAFDGWVLPKAGVAFVWVLDEDTVHSESKSRSSKPPATA